MIAFDILWASDMRIAGDTGLRVAQEVRCASRFGYHCGLLHVTMPRRSGSVHPEVRRCVREEGAEVVEPGQAVRARLLIIHFAGRLVEELLSSFPRLAVDRVVVVVGRAGMTALGKTNRLLKDSFGVVSWAPANPWARSAVASVSPKLITERDDWLCAVESGDGSGGGNRSVGVLAWIKADGEAPPAPTQKDDGLAVVSLRQEARRGRKAPRGAAEVELGALATERTLRRIDALAYFPSDFSDPPDALIAAALTAGKIVMLPQTAKRHYGHGPIYCTRRRVLPLLRALRNDQSALKAARRTARAGAAAQCSPAGFRCRIEALIGRPQNPHLAAKSRRSQRTAGVLFVAGDSDHDCVGRLLTVARHCNGRLRPVFVTMTPDPSVIEQFGYVAEYFTEPDSTATALELWDDWRRLEVERHMADYAAKVVVFDGRRPSLALMQGLASHGECRLLWLRPGLETASGAGVDQAGELFDLVMRAGDVPDDASDSSGERHTALGPLRLIEANGLLGRAEAAGALGLDAAKPSLLIRLDRADTLEAIPMVEAILQLLGRSPRLQIVVSADVGGQNLRLLSAHGVTCASGFPISRYRMAFDMSIARPTYAAFHDAIGLELPTIFLIDDACHPGQIQRADYAEREGAALSLSEIHLSGLTSMVGVLLSENARAHLRTNCRRIRSPNGAGRAAEIISELVH
jgi:hypothetical protein